jgi:hypothetical protein
MRRSLLRTWLGTIVFVAVLACGCQHTPRSCRQCCASGCRAPAAPGVSNPTTYAPNSVEKTPPREGSILPITNQEPIIHTAAKPDPARSTDVAMMTESHKLPARAEVDPGVLQQVINPYREGAAGRRTFTDITAHPKFAHDPNYRWLVGKLEYSKIQHAWIVRFASVEEDDRYGGSVTLENPGRMTAYQSGQLVRVEGQLVNPDDMRPRPAFHAYSIRPVEP